MDSVDTLTVAIPILVALAVLVLFTTRRRDDVRRAVSRETRRRDDSASAFLPQGDAPLTGRELERQVAAGRRATSVLRDDVSPVAPDGLVADVPPGPETLGVTRRQFFNRSIVAMSALGLSGFGAAVLAFLWPTLSGGFGSRIRFESATSMTSSRLSKTAASRCTWHKVASISRPIPTPFW